MGFPSIRMRLRRSEGLRALVRETVLTPGDLVYPLFICPGKGVRRAVSSMPGIFNVSVDEAVREAEEAAQLGLGGLLLFGLPESKDEQGTGAWDENGIVQQALRALKKSEAAKKLVLIADVCLCEYTSHGHCGVVVTDRAARRFRRGQRCHIGAFGAHCRQPGQSRRRYRRSQRHDGRPRGRHPPRA